MNSRQRFLATLSGKPTDRPPLFQEGIRDEVLEAWQRQGLAKEQALEDLFVYDEFEEFAPDLYPQPELRRWPKTRQGLKELRKRLDADDPRRLPENWPEPAEQLRMRGGVLMLRAHNGFFLSLGIEDAQSFNEMVVLLKDDPGYVREALNIKTEFACRLAECLLADVTAEALIIGEPVASSHGPLISPKMYADFVLASYEPLLDLAERHQIRALIFRSYANFKALLPVVLQRRFNCVWACECEPGAMDYRRVREEYGNQIGLIGGVDGDVLRQDKDAIRREVEEKVVPLLELRRYIPLADGRVRDDVPFESYAFYRRLLEEVCVNR